MSLPILASSGTSHLNQSSEGRRATDPRLAVGEAQLSASLPESSEPGCLSESYKKRGYSSCGLSGAKDSVQDAQRPLGLSGGLYLSKLDPG